MTRVWLTWWLLGLSICALGCGPRLGPGRHTPSGPDPEVRFVDDTVSAGLKFRQRHGGCGKAYFVEQTGAGAALFDMDSDGDLDLFFPQPARLPGCNTEPAEGARLFRNDGKGRFELVPGAGGAVCSDYGIGAAAGDYDGDGHLDLFVSCWGRSHLFRNDGSGRFRDVTSSAHIDRRGYSTSAAWLDYDKDGRLDLFVCGYVEWEPNTPVQCPAADGRPDYCTPQAFTPDKSSLFRNMGNGTFQDVTTATGLAEEHDRALGVLATDLDGDGWTDLFVSNDNGANMLFRNQGNGKFANEAMIRAVAFGAGGKPQSNMGIASGDYDRDQDQDVVVTTFANEPFTLYQNEGSYFSDVSAAVGLAAPTYVPLGFGTMFLDVNQDGWLDLFFANGHVEQYINQRSTTQTFAQANQLFLSNGAGGFAERPAALPADGRRVHRAVAAGDVDQDGDLDLVVTALDDRPTLLRNVSKGGAWLIVDARDAAGSPSAVGTKVRVTTDQATLTGWVVGGGSYLSQSDYALHFGLGSSSRVKEVAVTWPDGRQEALADVPINQRLRIDAKPRH